MGAISANLRMWPMGWAPAFQAGKPSSSLGFRSNSGVSEHLAPMISRGNGGRYVLDPKGSGAAGALGGVRTTSRVRTQPNWINAPVAKLADAPASGAGFLGVRPSPGAPRLSQISEEGPDYLCGMSHGDKGAHAPVSALLRDFFNALLAQPVEHPPCKR